MITREVIAKSNELIDAPLYERLTITEQRIIFFICSQIDFYNDTDFKIIKISIKQFGELIGVEGDNLYSKENGLVAICKGLQKKTFSAKKQDGSFLMVQWISSVEIIPYKGIIEIEISEKLKPYLLQLKENYTKYPFQELMRFKSANTLRMFEIVSRYKFHKYSSWISISDMKSLLGMKNTEYAEYKTFKRDVLNPAQKEISKHIDFFIEEFKKGKKVEAVRFVYSNLLPIKDDKDKNKDKDKSENINDMIHALSQNWKQLYKECQNFTSEIGELSMAAAYKILQHKTLSEALLIQQNMIFYLSISKKISNQRIEKGKQGFSLVSFYCLACKYGYDIKDKLLEE